MNRFLASIETLEFFLREADPITFHHFFSLSVNGNVDTLQPGFCYSLEADSTEIGAIDYKPCTGSGEVGFFGHKCIQLGINIYWSRNGYNGCLPTNPGPSRAYFDFTYQIVLKINQYTECELFMRIMRAILQLTDTIFYNVRLHTPNIVNIGYAYATEVSIRVEVDENKLDIVKNQLIRDVEGIKNALIKTGVIDSEDADLAIPMDRIREYIHSNLRR